MVGEHTQDNDGTLGMHPCEGAVCGHSHVAGGCWCAVGGC